MQFVYYLGEHLAALLYGGLLLVFILIVLSVRSLRREAFGYCRQSAEAIADIGRFIVWTIRLMPRLWRAGRQWSTNRWPKLGRTSWVYTGIAAVSAALLVGLASRQAISLLTPPRPVIPPTTLTWTSDADWRTWSLDQVEVKNGALTLINDGGKGVWTKSADNPLPSGLQLVAASDSDVWVSDGLSVAHLDKQNKWTTHKGLVAPGTTISALWADGREAAALSDYGAVIHWDGERWCEPEYVSQKDGEWLHSYCAIGHWDNLFVGAQGAIFHRQNGAWKQEVEPGSNIGAFEGLTELNGEVFAANEVGSVWRRSTAGTWQVAFSGPIPWKGIGRDGNAMIGWDRYGGVYLFELTPTGLNARPMDACPLKARGLYAGSIVGAKTDGHTGIWNTRTEQTVAGPTDDDLIAVTEVSPTKAWAISGSALYDYNAEPRYRYLGSATTALVSPNTNSAASLLADLPPNTKAEVLFSTDGHRWCYRLSDAMAADEDTSPLVLVRLSLTGTERSTPSVKALTIGPPPQ